MEQRNDPDIIPTRGHAAKRDSIIEAAASVFCREGFAGANIDLIAAEACVSRQTVYNHHGCKEKLFSVVLSELTARCNARSFSVLGTFPDRPKDLEADLVEFAVRLNKNFLYDRDAKFLRKLIQSEGERYPEIFDQWYEEGPGKVASALAAHFARMAFAGHLDIDDPDVAAQQFLALIGADIKLRSLFGQPVPDEKLRASAKAAVHTFLRAYGKERVPRGG
ncbi:TetR/AcrR family transcriptional regulator [Nitratireductor thuwali]|uniref:HTH-type transcriptional repressor n=1 Tax=Nitratireductor thuwali TaxID=2267699 RepID=A0ABY5MJP9_9HYPH|nr:HTH-type transcriptional repressor [Nitratireductor thuwali]